MAESFSRAKLRHAPQKEGGIDATHARGKVLRAWKDRCKPYSINILTLLGETRHLVLINT